jgi:hypothetical protein
LAQARVAAKQEVSSGRNSPAPPAGLDAAVKHPAGLGELVGVLQQQAQVGQAGRLGGRVGLAEHGVEGLPGPGQVPFGVAHAGGQQQRRRGGPGGGHRPLGQLAGLGGQLEAAWWSRL